MNGPEDDEPVTLTEQDFGTRLTQSNLTTTYSSGTPTQQGGTTVQMAETQSLVENNSYTDVTTDIDNDTTGDDGDPSEKLTTEAAAQYEETASSNSGSSSSEQKQGIRVRSRSSFASG